MLSGSYKTGFDKKLLNDGLWTYTFDSEGNEIQKTSGSGEKWKYSYDLQNHLTSAIDINSSGVTVTYATYVYDVFGNRIEKDVWTQQSGQTTESRFGYVGDQAWVDLNSSYALVMRYLRGDSIDELFARISSGGTASWYLPDHLGSIRNLTDNTGMLIDTIAYDAYGKVKSESNPANGDIYKWAELQYDAAIGLNFAKARPEDPSTGRWLEQDPLGFRAGDRNLYRYSFNDPVNENDPIGLKPLGAAIPIAFIGEAKPWLNNINNAPALDGVKPHLLIYWNHADDFGVLSIGIIGKGEGLPRKGWYYWDQGDAFMAGYANSLTGGGSTKIREWIWGDAASRNHQGTAFQIGEGVGHAHQIALIVGGAAQMGQGLAQIGSGLAPAAESGGLALSLPGVGSVPAGLAAIVDGEALGAGMAAIAEGGAIAAIPVVASMQHHLQDLRAAPKV